TITGEDAGAYIRRSIIQAGEFHGRVENYLNDASSNQEAVVQRIYREDFEEAKAIQQAVRPYMINLAAQVKVVAEGK
ncbi:MAG: hypothetical protein PHN75_06100, partial [Syntrophales bacterium]|nr:hypothetical protein [Syntrophales bacterium]